jgi:hypothetical protein
LSGECPKQIAMALTKKTMHPQSAAADAARNHWGRIAPSHYQGLRVFIYRGRTNAP